MAGGSSQQETQRLVDASHGTNGYGGSAQVNGSVHVSLSTTEKISVPVAGEGGNGHQSTRGEVRVFVTYRARCMYCDRTGGSLCETLQNMAELGNLSM